MSVFDLPRLYFGGTAVTRLPTGPRGGLVDLAGNTALRGASPGPGQSGRVAPFGVDGPAGEYHEHLAAHGARGEHFSGNGHFLFDARVTGVQRVDGSAVDTADPVVGRAVDLWGHYNPYLGTTVNRARVFDVDPASAWTTTVMGGQFAFGREGRSHDAGYLCVGDVTGFMPPRWHGFTPVCRTLHQFAIEAGEALEWPAGSADSPAVRALRAAAEVREGGGLLVQFTLDLREHPYPGRAGRGAQRIGAQAVLGQDELADEVPLAEPQAVVREPLHDPQRLLARLLAESGVPEAEVTEVEDGVRDHADVEIGHRQRRRPGQQARGVQLLVRGERVLRAREIGVEPGLQVEVRGLPARCQIAVRRQPGQDLARCVGRAAGGRQARVHQLELPRVPPVEGQQPGEVRPPPSPFDDRGRLAEGRLAGHGLLPVAAEQRELQEGLDTGGHRQVRVTLGRVEVPRAPRYPVPRTHGQTRHGLIEAD